MGDFLGVPLAYLLVTFLPKQQHGGLLSLVEEGDEIVINIKDRIIQLEVSEIEIKKTFLLLKMKGKNPFTPKSRKREVTEALKAYALLAASADKGGVRDLSLAKRISFQPKIPDYKKQSLTK